MAGESLDLQTVQGTMLIPLWGRAEYSRQNPEIVNDKTAIELVKQIDFDFSEIANSFGEFGGLCYILRARKIDDAVRSFLQRHPRATVVNIGAGLDTTFDRVDNGQIRWYNLDLPDAIAFRQTLIPDSARNTCIPKSFFDLSWFDDVVFHPADGILFVCGGVFYYFTEEDMRNAVTSMAGRFPGGELFFDAESKRAVAFSNKMVARTGNKGAMMHFYVNSPKALAAWSPHIARVTCEGFFSGVSKSRNWSSQSRMRMRVLNGLGMMKLVHVWFSM